MKVAQPRRARSSASALITLGAALILVYFYTAAGGKLPLSGEGYTVKVRRQRAPAAAQARRRARRRRQGRAGRRTIKNRVRAGPLRRDRDRARRRDVAPIYRDAT